MKENDIVRRGGDILRILAIRDDRCLCINCNATRMPIWILMDEIKECANDTEPAIDTNMNVWQKQEAHERFTMIAPLLAYLTDTKERNRFMYRISEEQGISKQAVIIGDHKQLPPVIDPILYDEEKLTWKNGQFQRMICSAIAFLNAYMTMHLIHVKLCLIRNTVCQQ